MARNLTIFDRETITGKGIPLLNGQKRIPSWNTPGRPKRLKEGTFGYNSQTKNLEYWNGYAWLKLHMKKI